MTKLRYIFFLFISGFSLTICAQNQKEIDSLERLLPNAKDTTRVNILSDLCLDYEFVDADKSFRYGQDALALGKKIGHKRGLANAYTNLALLLEDRSEYDKCGNYLQTALKLYQELGQQTDIAQAYTNLGVMCDYKGDYEKAIDYYNKGLDISYKINDDKGISGTLYNLGIIYSNRGDYSKALENWNKALPIFEKTKEKEGISSVYLSMGVVYKRQGNFDKAIQHYSLALKLAEEIGEKRLLSDIYNNFGVAYLEDKKDFVKATEYFQKSLEISMSLNDTQGTAVNLFNIGDAKKEQKQYDEALDYYFKALKSFDYVGDKLGSAKADNHIANAYKEKGDYKKCIEYSDKAIALNAEMKLKDDLVDDYAVLADGYSLMGDYPNAFRTHVLYSNMKDSVLNESNNKQILEMQSKYETEKKEKEIELLKQKEEIQNSELKNKRIVLYAVIGALFLLFILSLAVYSRYQIKQKANVKLEEQNSEIQLQKTIIEERNKDITDSIKYAKRIQEAILPSVESIREKLPETFILFKPKDIVSGDFYFYKELKNNLSVIAAVDCTGHGVPGAFMSIVGYNALNQCVNEFGLSAPAEILDQLNTLVSDNFQNNQTDVKDGMDISLCTIDRSKNILQYAGAFNSLYLVRDESLQETKADKIIIGNTSAGGKSFTNHSIDLKKNDMIYLFTDGYADQFGGPKGKKIKYKFLQEYLCTISTKSIEEQHRLLDAAIEDWRGSLEQVDDICIIGVRV